MGITATKMDGEKKHCASKFTFVFLNSLVPLFDQVSCSAHIHRHTHPHTYTLIYVLNNKEAGLHLNNDALTENVLLP